MRSAAADVPGLFVTIEGSDGAGKTTQMARLAARLSALGHDVLATREPGGSPGAEVIRNLLLSQNAKLSLRAEIMLMFAARFDHVDTTILPALSQGRLVLCDRFSDSTLAYQGCGLGHGAAPIVELIRKLDAMLGLQPRLTLILDVTADDRRRRIADRAQRQDRYEQLEAAFHGRVAESFRLIAAGSPDRCRLVDGSGAADLVERRLFAALAPVLT